MLARLIASGSMLLAILQAAWALTAVPPSVPFLDLRVINSTAIYANFTSPLSNGGSPITGYKLEWDTDPGPPELPPLTPPPFPRHAATARPAQRPSATATPNIP
eukprot:gene22235-25194_t